MSNHYQNFGNSLRKSWKAVFPAMLLTAGMLAATEAEASHYRGATLSWQNVPGQPNTVEFKLNVAYADAFPTGSLSYGEYIDFGDGQSGYIDPVVTSANIEENWHYATATFRHTYAGTGAYTINWAQSCCRISELLNNPDGNYNLQTIVTVGSNNNSPVTSMPPIVNVARDQAAASFTVPASDPDGNPVTFRLATDDEAAYGSTFTQPAGLSINAATGVVTFNTMGKAAGDLYTVSLMLEDGFTKTPVDFIVKITDQSTAPAFDYAITPANNFVYKVTPGQTVNFAVSASDSDPGDIVSLQAIGLPSSGASFTTAGTGNPVSGTFSWTTDNSQLGTTWDPLESTCRHASLSIL